MSAMMKVIFNTNEGRCFEQNIPYFCNVLKIKETLQHDHNFPISRQTLFIYGHIMEDDRDIHSYGVDENSRIFLRLNPEKELKQDPPKPTNASVERMKVAVLVPMEGGKMRRVEVEINLSDKVSELRNELLRMRDQIHDFHLPADGFIFIYKKAGMNENKTFRWHKVKSEDVIEIFNGSVMGG